MPAHLHVAVACRCNPSFPLEAHTYPGRLCREALAAVQQALQSTLLDDVRDVVLVIRQAVKRKGGIVLQVLVLALEQLKQGAQAATLQTRNRTAAAVSRGPAGSQQPETGLCEGVPPCGTVATESHAPR